MAPTKTVKPTSQKSTGKAASSTSTFYIDYSVPANDKIFDSAAFEKFLQDRIKVDNRPGQLGDKVKTERQSSGRIAITSTIPMSKRYLKYLTKKYLKKNQMREWLRVVATAKDTYQLKFFNVDDDEAEADSE